MNFNVQNSANLNVSMAQPHGNALNSMNPMFGAMPNMNTMGAMNPMNPMNPSSFGVDPSFVDNKNKMAKMEMDMNAMSAAMNNVSVTPTPPQPTTINTINNINNANVNCGNSIPSNVNCSMPYGVSAHASALSRPTLNSISHHAQKELQSTQLFELQQLQQIQQMKHMHMQQSQQMQQMQQMQQQLQQLQQMTQMKQQQYLQHMQQLKQMQQMRQIQKQMQQMHQIQQLNPMQQTINSNQHQVQMQPIKLKEPVQVQPPSPDSPPDEADVQCYENIINDTMKAYGIQMGNIAPSIPKPSVPSLPLPVKPRYSKTKKPSVTDESKNIVSFIGGRVALIPSVHSVAAELFPPVRRPFDLQCRRKRTLRNPGLKRSITTFEPHRRRSSARKQQQKRRKLSSCSSLSQNRSTSCGVLTAVRE
eukprot:118915_1